MSAKVESFSQGGMTFYTIEGTAPQIQEAMDAIMSRYHPLGYGTSFKPMEHKFSKGNDIFQCHGSRSNSCD